MNRIDGEMTTLGRVVVVTGSLSLLLVLGATVVSVWLSAVGFVEPDPVGCPTAGQRGGNWASYAFLAILVGTAIAVVSLIYGRRVPFRLRIPAAIAAVSAIPLWFVVSVLGFIAYGAEC